MAAPRAFGSHSLGPSSDLRQRVHRRARRAFGFGSPSPGPSSDRRQHVRRRAPIAFVFGAVIAAAGLVALSPGFAGAHGPFTAANPTTFAAAPPTLAAYFPVAEARAKAAPPRTKRQRITVIAGASREVGGYSGRGPVCVRLCDGAFFPLDAAAGDPDAQSAACDRLCPDAPTEVFYRNGSDQIGDAISTAGRRYSALPVALRYQRASDATCTCHRSLVAYAPLRDATLRRGDAIMTPAGLVVFRGAEGGAHRPADFTALDQMNMPRPQRANLQAIEHASVAANHPGLQQWLAAQGAPALAQRDLASADRGDNRIRVLVWRGHAED
jgi:Protein of unknown function (DUF2865)